MELLLFRAYASGFIFVARFSDVSEVIELLAVTAS
jgi:hypothetical protein